MTDAMCWSCFNSRRIRIAGRSVACPKCSGVMTEAHNREAARSQLRACAARWLANETGDENLRMALQGAQSAGYDLGDCSRLIDCKISRETMAKVLSGQRTVERDEL